LLAIKTKRDNKWKGENKKDTKEMTKVTDKQDDLETWKDGEATRLKIQITTQINTVALKETSQIDTRKLKKTAEKEMDNANRALL